MSFPTAEQEAILLSKNRITIVKAVPGSGKTRVFTNCIEAKLNELKQKKGGVAALSYTNSASQEISKRLNVQISSPHFVGTLDSFFFNFVIKPFGHFFEFPMSGASIIPAPIDEEMKAVLVQVGPSVSDKVSIHKVKFIGGNLEKPIFSYRNLYGVIIQISSDYSSAILRQKWISWRAKGKLTHSDCQYVSAFFLSDKVKGPQILRLLSLKFPWILIDEFQDTGYFLSLSVFRIFSCLQIRGLVVGDPDQAIFEFSGSNPENFSLLENIEGSLTMPISRTQRCAKKISKVAESFTSNKIKIDTREDAYDGKLVICSHKSNNPEFDNKLIKYVEALNDVGSILIIARKNKELSSLKGDLYDQSFMGSSNAGKIISKAVEKFKNGKGMEAFKSMSTLLGELMFEKEITREIDLEDLGIEWIAWKKEIMTILVQLDQEIAGESWNSWLMRAKILIETVSKKILGKEKKLGQRFKIDKKNGSKIRSITRLQSKIPSVFTSAEFKNTHEAKGGEADTVIWYIPKQAAKKCSVNSWFGSVVNLEELRVAFVTITRAKKNLIICMHSETLERFKTLKPELAKMFENVD